MFKISKNKAILVIFVKVILFTFVLFFFYLQVKKINFSSFSKIQISSFVCLFLTILLVLVNHFFEFLKWLNTLKVLSIQTDLKIKMKSYMAGNLTGFLTPNLLGNFIGRLFYFERRKRISLTFLTLVSNASQFVASIVFGLIALLILGFPKNFFVIDFKNLLFLTFFFMVILLTIYFTFFNISNFFFKSKNWFKVVCLEVKYKSSHLINQLFFSLLRHVIFSFQYFLLLKAFGLDVEIETLFYIWQIYFWSTLIPSFWLGKLFIRESVALWIFSQISNQYEIILISSVTLWLINQGLPAIIGIPYLKFSKK